MKKVKENLPFSLPVAKGSEAPKDTFSSEKPDTFLLGSEIEPKMIGETHEGDPENGTYFEREWWLIVQNHIPFLVERLIETYSYGCDFGKDGSMSDYFVFNLKGINTKNLIKK